MFRITAVMAKAIFSTWFSCFQTISFMEHIATKDSALDSVTPVHSKCFQNSTFGAWQRSLGNMTENVTA